MAARPRCVPCARPPAVRPGGCLRPRIPSPTDRVVEASKTGPPRSDAHVPDLSMPSAHGTPPPRQDSARVLDSFFARATCATRSGGRRLRGAMPPPYGPVTGIALGAAQQLTSELALPGADTVLSSSGAMPAALPSCAAATEPAALLCHKRLGFTGDLCLGVGPSRLIPSSLASPDRSAHRGRLSGAARRDGRRTLGGARGPVSPDELGRVPPSRVSRRGQHRSASARSVYGGSPADRRRQLSH